jgi:hypothetical protein
LGEHAGTTGRYRTEGGCVELCCEQLL